MVDDSQQDRFIERAGWPEGPWDNEPDILISKDIVMQRLPFGAWAALVGVDPKFKSRLLEMQDSRTYTGDRELQIVEFDEKSRNADRFDTSRVYVGYFFIAPQDLSPAHAQYIADFPAKLRDKIGPQYVTMDAALNILFDLCDELKLEGVITL